MRKLSEHFMGADSEEWLVGLEETVVNTEDTVEPGDSVEDMEVAQ